jgi:hypothetical protein
MRTTAELDRAAAELDAKTAELDAKTAELDAKTAELQAKTTELTTCSWAMCDASSVYGLRCSSGHGLCAEHTDEFCRAYSEYVCPTNCVFYGCSKEYERPAFERSGAGPDLVASCVQRLHRIEFEREAEVSRARDREARARDTARDGEGLTATELQDAVHLRRPCCQRIFGDFSECLAVTCDNEACRRFFCGLCLEAHFAGREDCHAHARICNKRHFGVESYFLSAIHADETAEEMRQRISRHYEGIRALRLRPVLNARGVDVPPPPTNHRY